MDKFWDRFIKRLVSISPDHMGFFWFLVIYSCPRLTWSDWQVGRSCGLIIGFVGQGHDTSLKLPCHFSFNNSNKGFWNRSSPCTPKILSHAVHAKWKSISIGGYGITSMKHHYGDFGRSRKIRWKRLRKGGLDWRSGHNVLLANSRWSVENSTCSCANG